MNEDKFVLHGKEVVKPGLEHAKISVIDVEIEKNGRGAFYIKKGLQATTVFC